MSSDVTAGRWTTSFKKNSGKYASAEKAILAAQAFAEEAEERQKLAARAAEEQEAGASRSSEAATSVRAYTVQLQDVPRVFPPEETIAGAAKRAAKVQGNEALRTEGERAGNRAARRLDALMKELTSRLGGYMRGFPRYSALHPFNRKLLDLVTGRQNYERILAKVDSLRKAVVQVAKSYAAKASAAKSVEEAERMEKAGFQAVREVFARGKYGVEELMKVAKAFRQIPTIDPLVPTVALVGAPNVGKSSLVQVMSSGLPEVCHYPFTTRSIKMGHFYVNGRRHQVTDTPGVLARPDEERNTMEMLTLATLDHLPTAVLFVADLTEECGTSVSDQWRIRQELKQRYPDKLWVDVLSKQDLLEWEFEEAGPPLPMETATSESPCDAAEELGDVEDAVQFARRLPRAHRVSSLTNAGIDDLKSSVIDMLSARNLGEQLEQLSAREQDRLNTPDPSSAPFSGSNVA